MGDGSYPAMHCALRRAPTADGEEPRCPDDGHCSPYRCSQSGSRSCGQSQDCSSSPASSLLCSCGERSTHADADTRRAPSIAASLHLRSRRSRERAPVRAQGAATFRLRLRHSCVRDARRTGCVCALRPVRQAPLTHPLRARTAGTDAVRERRGPHDGASALRHPYGFRGPLRCMRGFVSLLSI